MISENDKKYLEIIENLVNQCLNKINDFYFIRSTFAEIIRIYENLEDKALQTILQNRSKEILIAKDQSKIKKYVEEKILNSPVYQEKLHEPLKNKYWGKNCQHARLSDNLRIIYSYIPKKKFKFEAIVTHNELDKN